MHKTVQAEHLNGISRKLSTTIRNEQRSAETTPANKATLKKLLASGVAALVVYVAIWLLIEFCHTHSSPTDPAPIGAARQLLVKVLLRSSQCGMNQIYGYTYPYIMYRDLLIYSHTMVKSPG